MHPSLTELKFSQREDEIVRLVAEGRKNGEIGQALGISVNVVKDYLCAIYAKVGAWNRVELALWYEAHRNC
jgi:DNA-binding NarL/FixJ family response regulator